MILRLLARRRTGRRTAIPAQTVETPRRSSVNLFKGHTTRSGGVRRGRRHGLHPQATSPGSGTLPREQAVEAESAVRAVADRFDPQPVAPNHEACEDRSSSPALLLRQCADRTI